MSNPDQIVRYVDCPLEGCIDGEIGIDAAAANMAIDSALLEADDAMSLRFYRWPDPTLTLGYFQKSRDRDSHPPSLPLAVLRRASGGGAIVHHHEWTYALVVPRERIKHADDPTDFLYRLVHNAFAESLAEQGFPVQLHEQTGRCDGDCDAFLCFRRRSQYDLIHCGYKVLGSAQRRGRSAILQHGSLLIRASRHAPELPGLENLGGHAVNARKLIDDVSRRLAGGLDAETIDRNAFDTSVLTAARQIAGSKFANPQWLARR